jgi:heme/copper-type cytochrome/quinol oxidase subunit 1
MDFFTILTLLVAIPTGIAALLNIIKMLYEAREEDVRQRNM